MEVGQKASSQILVASCGPRFGARAAAPQAVVVAAGSELIVVIAAMTVLDGATIPLRIVKYAQGVLTAVLRHQHAGESIEPDKPHGGGPQDDLPSRPRQSAGQHLQAPVVRFSIVPRESERFFCMPDEERLAEELFLPAR